MHVVFPDIVVLDGLKNEKKGFPCTTERAKIIEVGGSTTMIGPQIRRLWQSFF
jgi:hypothetical protein